MRKKIFAISIIALFIGIAFVPTSNALFQSDSEKKDFLEEEKSETSYNFFIAKIEGTMSIDVLCSTPILEKGFTLNNNGIIDDLTITKMNGDTIKLPPEGSTETWEMDITIGFFSHYKYINPDIALCEVKGTVLLSKAYERQ